MEAFADDIEQRLADGVIMLSHIILLMVPQENGCRILMANLAILTLGLVNIPDSVYDGIYNITD
jgi:hypothetical protein